MSNFYRRTRIVATLGPASSEVEMIRRLIHAGADVFRINFSHGTLMGHQQTLKNIKLVAEELGSFPGTLADLQGPKIRTGRTRDDQPVMLQAGTLVTLTCKRQICDERTIFIDHKPLIASLRKDQRVLINDGAVALQVVNFDDRTCSAQAVVLNTGYYSSHKGVNVPGMHLPIPSLTPKDVQDLRFILQTDIPFIALSFVRSAEDVQALRRRIKKVGKAVKILAKIEKPEAVENIQEILEVADGIMVARGDLGIELSLPQLPVVQKDLITFANEKEKLVIVATQMLESMISNPLPTRAECADVANAILDGADAIMLSGETAVGRYPLEAVQMMHHIAVTTESSAYYPSEPQDRTNPRQPMMHALCEAAAWASRDLNHVPALVFTISGDTALRLAKIRYHAPIYAFTPSPQTAAMLALNWNTKAFLLPFNEDFAALERSAVNILLRQGLIVEGQCLLTLSGTTPVRGGTNVLRIMRVKKE